MNCWDCYILGTSQLLELWFVTFTCLLVCSFSWKDLWQSKHFKSWWNKIIFSFVDHIFSIIYKNSVCSPLHIFMICVCVCIWDQTEDLTLLGKCSTTELHLHQDIFTSSITMEYYYITICVFSLSLLTLVKAFSVILKIMRHS